MHFLEIIKLQFGKKNSIPCFILWRYLELMLLKVAEHSLRALYRFC